MAGQQAPADNRNKAGDLEQYRSLPYSAATLQRDLSRTGAARRVKFEGEMGQRWISQSVKRRSMSGSTLGQVVRYEEFSTLAREKKRQAWLDSTLGELVTCEEQALEDGIEKPSVLALQKAKGLLETLAGHVDEQPSIYPMDERSIMIDFRNPDIRAGVLFLIEDGGSGVCFSRTPKSRGRVRVEDASDLLAEGGLLEIGKVGIR